MSRRWIRCATSRRTWLVLLLSLAAGSVLTGSSLGDSSHVPAPHRATAGGTVVAWGCGTNFGQCNVPSGLTGVIALAASQNQSLALKSDGTVVAWGCIGNDSGECSVPRGLSGVTAIAAGGSHSLALKRDGTVVAWGCGGDADFGQCKVPTRLSGVTAIAAGLFHSVALKRDGTVVAWGCGGGGTDFGQCDVPSGLSDVTAIAAGRYHSLALKRDGTVTAWGCGPGGFSGQCSVPSGLSGVTMIAAGAAHSLALKSDGSVVVWGCANDNVGQCDVPGGLSGVSTIAAGWYHSLALKHDGTVVAWGCGDGTNVGQCNVPGGLSGVTAIAGGYFHSLALVEAVNRPPDCSRVSATPGTLSFQGPDRLTQVTLSGATDADGGTLAYRVDRVTQDEPVIAPGDHSWPDAVFLPGWPGGNRLLVRAEANPHFNGRVYRIAFTVADRDGATCSGTAGPNGTTTAKIAVPRNQRQAAVDDGDTTSWNSFTGAPVR